MQERHTTTTTTTTKTRENTGCGFLFGFVILAVSIGLLFWNEGNSVREHTGLQEGLAQVVEFGDSKNVVSKLVHLTGRLTTLNDLERPLVVDAEFGVAATGVYLDRIVEMLQWEEERHDHTYTENGQEKTDVTYSYKKSWSADAIDSDSFHDSSYVNPSQWLYKSKKIAAPSVVLQGYRVPALLLDQITTRSPISLDTASLKQMASILELSLHVQQDIDTIPALKTMEIRHNEFYTKPGKKVKSRDRASIGDVRVKFQVAPANAVSVLAMPVDDGTLQPFKTSSGYAIALLEEGLVSANDMIANAKAAVSAWTWALRFVGLILAILGFNVLLQPIVDLAHLFLSVPLLGSFVVAVASWSVNVMSGLLGVSTTLVVVAIAWVWYRPLVALGLVLVAITPYFAMPKPKKADVKLAMA